MTREQQLNRKMDELAFLYNYENKPERRKQLLEEIRATKRELERIVFEEANRK